MTSDKNRRLSKCLQIFHTGNAMKNNKHYYLMLPLCSNTTVQCSSEFRTLLQHNVKAAIDWRILLSCYTTSHKLCQINGSLPEPAESVAPCVSSHSNIQLAWIALNQALVIQTLCELAHIEAVCRWNARARTAAQTVVRSVREWSRDKGQNENETRPWFGEGHWQKRTINSFAENFLKKVISG